MGENDHTGFINFGELSMDELMDRIKPHPRVTSFRRPLQVLLERLIRRTKGLNERLREVREISEQAVLLLAGREALDRLRSRSRDVAKGRIPNCVDSFAAEPLLSRLDEVEEAVDHLLDVVEDRQEAELRERLGAGTATERVSEEEVFDITYSEHETPWGCLQVAWKSRHAKLDGDEIAFGAAREIAFSEMSDFTLVDTDE